MPITAEEMRRLSTAELLGIRSLAAFEQQGDKIDELLIHRSGLPIEDFKALHGQAGCNVERTYLRSTPSGFFDTIYFVEQPFHYFRLECDVHGVVSQEFGDFSF